MKILFVIRKNAFKIPGGDFIQLSNTKKELEKKGVICHISFGIENLERIIDNFDIIHLFNLQTPLTTLRAAHIAKKHKKKIVVSTIYFNIWSIVSGIFFMKAGLKMACRSKLIQKSFYSFYKHIFIPPFFVIPKIKEKYKDSILNPEIFQMIKEIIEIADLLLPNSKEELKQLHADMKEMGCKDVEKKSKIVINAIDKKKFTNLPKTNNKYLNDLFEKIRTKQKIIVGEVGRIENGKNQVAIVKSLMKRKDIGIIFIGKHHNNSYYRKLKKISAIRNGVYFIDHVLEEDIPYIMKQLDVHVLPSIRETPGLTSLEAAVVGTPIVSTVYAPNREYFKDYAYICDPFNLKDIYNKIILANDMDKNKREDMRNYILNNFTWEIAAKQTLDAYGSVLRL
ncbi:hypothetical protein CVT91_01190 [Candidatus Atribacteria bacterium HGW-Atribacteria-1]|nr:MAG: hypothetical protein CVT91_01190 [Candidatus Atribacteria bacterium HGW-Atribacteria-1]